MFRIAICDDDVTACSQIEAIIENFDRTAQIDVFYSGERLCDSIANDECYDLIFLDIEMGEQNGVQTGKRIREEMKKHNIQIVYVSAKENYAMQLFKIRPFDFLIKPVSSDEIISILKQVQQDLSVSTVFEYQLDSVVHRIDLSEIVYFESIGRKIKIVTLDQVVSIYGKLYELKNKVGEKDFILVHKSFLVNFKHVKLYRYDFLTLVNQEKIPISQQNRKIVREYFLSKRMGDYSQ